jgi:alpha-tubulin suppressor-like RCC1 family protein
MRRATGVAAVLFLLTCGTSAGTSIVPSIATGFTHTCSVTTEARCWGDNRSGQVGDGTRTERLTPVPIAQPNAGLVVAGSWAFHTCAITGGALACWGANESGQLGDGTKSDRLTPVPVVGLSSGVEAVSVGGGHTCAITTGGRLQCWGANDSGQLGTGGGPSLVPVTVPGLESGVVAVSAGGSHTCAIKSGGLLCWGSNNDDQIGNETCDLGCPTPVQVTGLDHGVAAVAASGFHTCALLSGGAVKCWGGNSEGELGDGTKKDRPTPVSVRGLSAGVEQLVVGGLHSCALLDSGGVKCWGYNSFGQLGDGTRADRLTPVAVRGLRSGVQQIAAGGDHTCALLTGETRCWGSNRYGQLGNGKHTWELDLFLRGGGTVTVRGFRCRGSSCFTEFAPGAKLAFKERADKGWKFVAWGESCKGRKPHCTVRLSADKGVKATFKRR